MYSRADEGVQFKATEVFSLLRRHCSVLNGAGVQRERYIQEQGVCAGIEPKLLFHNGRQAVNAAAQVRVTAGKVNLLRSAKVVQHDFSAWISAVSVASSAPL